jgi:hypothetical protein
MSEQQQTLITPNDGPAADAVAQAVLAAQMAIIDAAVRESRRQGWCTEFERIMGTLFPDGPPDGSAEYVDSDGWSCRDVDRDGYDRNGFHSQTGRNREGYDRAGWDAEGFNINGVDANGWRRDGWNADHTINRDSDEYRARFRFNRNGYDRDGYNVNRVHRDTGLPRAEHEAYMARQDRVQFVFDGDGYDANGRNRYGEQRY